MIAMFSSKSNNTIETVVVDILGVDIVRILIRQVILS